MIYACVTVGTSQHIAALHRQHYRRLVAPLIRILGSFEAAEDVVQEVFAQALRSWSDGAVPDEPLAWLHRVAKNRAIDHTRRQTRFRLKEAELKSELSASFEMDLDEGEVRDDTLRLIFTCCHPSLSPDAQIALTLHTICGLTSDEVARAFIVKKQTLQQRLVRAKRKIDGARIPYIVPDRSQLEDRLEAVLHTIYLVFNEGYGASVGDTLLRQELCHEGIRLGRLLHELVPDSTAATSLLALMQLHHARRSARTDQDGDLVTLEDQDRSLWDHELIAAALPLVEAGLKGRPVSKYALEAAIAALHVRAPKPEETDWTQIAALYRELLARFGPNPIVELNGAVAMAMGGDLSGGLRQLEMLEDQGRLSGYHLLPAAKADLLRRSGRFEEAKQAFVQSLALVSNPVERRFIERRLASLAEPSALEGLDKKK